jgi:nucleoside 2-deoxyribosyltransferase
VIRVYYISPVGADAEYASKRAVLASVGQSLNAEFVFPAGRGNAFVLEDMLAAICACDCVVADLSLERPSCYFEVGLAQAKSKRVALIAAEGTILHQAAGTDSTIRYGDLASFQFAVERAVRQVLEHQDT